MRQLDRLPELTDQVLSGLQADDSLKHRILLAAAGSSKDKADRSRTVLVLCCISAALLLLCIMIDSISVRKPDPQLQIIPAGNRRIVSPVNLQNAITQVSEDNPNIKNDAE